MFLFSIILGVVLGYLLKGNIENLNNLEIKGWWLIVLGFLVEFIMKIFLKSGHLEIGSLTYVLNIVMYSCIMAFIYINRKYKMILVIGIGFLLNIVVILGNGCTMPISTKAMDILNVSGQVETKGLYSIISVETKFKFLADVIPYKLWKYGGIASIGDIILSIGIIGIVIKGMKLRTD
ncbi:DUF5317 family protein [Clostridium sp. UBA7503]|uniref:DUF5317 family protein n=1 Tax=Clostridium sp. UBA7503 TaxID=1946377 RepID=UPI003216493F